MLRSVCKTFSNALTGTLCPHVISQMEANSRAWLTEKALGEDSDEDYDNNS